MGEIHGQQKDQCSESGGRETARVLKKITHFKQYILKMWKMSR
jgi:hypothetical protein